MVRVTSPLFSQKASKQLGKKIIFKTKGDKCFVTNYSIPGKINKFTQSETQTEMRELYTLAVTTWQEKSTSEKEYFNELVKTKRLNMSGWNYFYKLAVSDQPTYLGTAVCGTAICGVAICGNEL